MDLKNFSTIFFNPNRIKARHLHSAHIAQCGDDVVWSTTLDRLRLSIY